MSIYYKELKEFNQVSRECNWIEYFTKYKNLNTLSRELIENIYVYEDKKIKIKFKYEDEYNYLRDFIKRRKISCHEGVRTLSFLSKSVEKNSFIWYNAD